MDHKIPEGFKQHPDVDVEPSPSLQQQARPGNNVSKIESTSQKAIREDMKFGSL